MTAKRVTEPDEIVRCQACRCLGFLGRQSLFNLDDLLQEGQLCIITARAKWQPDRGSAFNTYLTRVLMNHFASILRRVRKQRLAQDDLEQAKEIPADDTCVRVGLDGKVWFQFRTGDDLSADATRLLSESLAAPPVPRSHPRNPHRTLAKVVSERLGWDNQRLKQVEEELFHKAFC